MEIKKPYLLFIGDAQTDLDVKMGRSLVHWKRELCAGEFRFSEAKTTLGLPKMDLKEAQDMGVKTVVIAINNPGGELKESWLDFIRQAIGRGFDIVSGMHTFLSMDESFKKLSESYKVNLFDLRKYNGPFKVGTGEKRSGRRILTVGTDCMVGKMFTALSLRNLFLKNELRAKFKATGQCGTIINGGEGIPVDAVPSDFISGVVEDLSPHSPGEIHLIEGQGSLLHPSFAGVTLGLVHGAQPDYLVLCHDPSRKKMRGNFDRTMPSIKDCFDLYLEAARVTNPGVQYLGISLNTSKVGDVEKLELMQKLEMEFKVPVFDPAINIPETICDNFR